ncbi:MAG: hypothetical protein ACM3VT_00115 [Solirubrobacterales bacterium]
MRMWARGIAAVVLGGSLLAVSGCYSSAISIAKCAAEAKKTESVECDFAAGSTLRVRNDFGPISVCGGDSAGCQVTGRIYVHAPTKREAREIGEQVRIAAEPNDGTVLVTAEIPPLEKDRGVWVDLRIAVPSRANVDCETEFGRVKFVGIEGDIRGHTEFGPITCNKIISGRIDVQTEFGAIHVKCEDASPADLVADARTEYGKIRFKAPESFGGSFDIRTEFGSTGAKLDVASRDQWTHSHKMGDVGSGKGRVSLQTEFGSVKLK